MWVDLGNRRFHDDSSFGRFEESVIRYKDLVRDIFRSRGSCPSQFDIEKILLVDEDDPVRGWNGALQLRDGAETSISPTDDDNVLFGHLEGLQLARCVL